jgi:hypothetical protein
MLTIHKFPVEGGTFRETTIPMPEDARVIHFGTQENLMFFWVLLNLDKPSVERRFHVVGTGWELHGVNEYIGTIQVGSFVWHAFEVKEVV